MSKNIQKIDGRIKLTDQQREDIIMLHQTGVKPDGTPMTYRYLASRYNVSQQTIKNVVDSCTQSVKSVAARNLRNNENDRLLFMAMVTKGVTPEIAAGTFGVSVKGLQALCDNDEDFAIELQKARYTKLANVETVFGEAAESDPDKSLTFLERAKETKQIWREEKQESGSGINIVMNWDRDPNDIKVIDNED